MRNNIISEQRTGEKRRRDTVSHLRCNVQRNGRVNFSRVSPRQSEIP